MHTCIEWLYSLGRSNNFQEAYYRIYWSHYRIWLIDWYLIYNCFNIEFREGTLLCSLDSVHSSGYGCTLQQYKKRWSAVDVKKITISFGKDKANSDWLNSCVKIYNNFISSLFTCSWRAGHGVTRAEKANLSNHFTKAFSKGLAQAW